MWQEVHNIHKYRTTENLRNSRARIQSTKSSGLTTRHNPHNLTSTEEWSWTLASFWKAKGLRLARSRREVGVRRAVRARGEMVGRVSAATFFALATAAGPRIYFSGDFLATLRRRRGVGHRKWYEFINHISLGPSAPRRCYPTSLPPPSLGPRDHDFPLFGLSRRPWALGRWALYWPGNPGSMRTSHKPYYFPNSEGGNSRSVPFDGFIWDWFWCHQ